NVQHAQQVGIPRGALGLPQPIGKHACQLGLRDAHHVIGTPMRSEVLAGDAALGDSSLEDSIDHGSTGNGAIQHRAHQCLELSNTLQRHKGETKDGCKDT
ncbi:MAG: hypothetical protein ACK56I_04190, partial [bacterium]